MKRVIVFGMMCLMVLTIKAQVFVDLGLPSGTMWKTENEVGGSYTFGYYTFDEAFKFGLGLPTKEQWEELKSQCRWSWTGSTYIVTGLNGNFITLPAEGYFYCSSFRNNVYVDGYYWSSTPEDSDNAWHMCFDKNSVQIRNVKRCVKQSVRLVRNGFFSGSSSGSDTMSTKKTVVQGYTDLGLPSGTLWKNENQPGRYTHKEAVKEFGSQLPTKEQWEELRTECVWSWTGGGYKVTGRNRNYIILPAEGYRSCSSAYGFESCFTQAVGDVGKYWSATAPSSPGWSIIRFDYSGVFKQSAYSSDLLSVRLVQN